MSDKTDTTEGRTERNAHPSAVKNPRFSEITGQHEAGKSWAEYEASKNPRFSLEAPESATEPRDATGMEGVKKALTDDVDVSKASEAEESLQDTVERALARLGESEGNTGAVDKSDPGVTSLLTREEIEAARRKTNAPVEEEIRKLREELEAERTERKAAVAKAAEEDEFDRLERGTEEALAKLEKLEGRLSS